MSSPIAPVRRWIVTTCRGRLAHLREALPTWLERLPNWDPIVVCCDDDEAATYAASELMAAKRGIAVRLTQGEYFNKLEALRAGIDFAQWGSLAKGGVFDAEAMDRSQLRSSHRPLEREMVALLDADTIATSQTAETLESIGVDEVGQCGFGTRDDLGLLVVNLDVLARGIALMPVGWFEGYGPEDCALRVACWTIVRKPFVQLPAHWVRRCHNDVERSRYHSRSVAEAVRINKQVMAELIERIVPPEDRKRCRAECMQWPQRRSAYEPATRVSTSLPSPGSCSATGAGDHHSADDPGGIVPLATTRPGDGDPAGVPDGGGVPGCDGDLPTAT
jgi:hypothetical protein